MYKLFRKSSIFCKTKYLYIYILEHSFIEKTHVRAQLPDDTEADSDVGDERKDYGNADDDVDVDADVDADDAVDNNYNEMMNSTELCELVWKHSIV